MVFYKPKLKANFFQLNRAPVGLAAAQLPAVLVRAALAGADLGLGIDGAAAHGHALQDAAAAPPALLVGPALVRGALGFGVERAAARELAPLWVSEAAAALTALLVGPAFAFGAPLGPQAQGLAEPVVEIILHSMDPYPEVVVVTKDCGKSLR